jgi:nucleotide-binding universal stress UspA family protein
MEIPSVQINQEVRTAKDVLHEPNKAARNYDLIVLGETEQDLGDSIFGPVGDYIADEQDVPVLIVR